MTRLLAGSRAAFTAVGDDDQAIYAWRGASIDKPAATCKTTTPTCSVIKLEQNYRSSQRILTCANHLITQQHQAVREKTVERTRASGDPIRVLAANDEEHEAECVVMRCWRTSSSTARAIADYAILYRSNHLSRVFEEQLRAQNIPYTVSGGTSFFERAEIKDIIAYLRLIANTDDDPAFIRAITTPKRGIGNRRWKNSAAYAGARHISLFAGSFRERAWRTRFRRGNTKT